MKYPKEYLDEIKLRLKVSQVVGKSVQLKKRGKEFIGLSPFNNEKTPSFTVNDDKEFYHCFSTGEHGNIFDFLMKTKSIGFGEAVKTLAAEAGMQPYRFSQFDKKKETRFQTYKKIYKEYSDHFHSQIFEETNKEALLYLGERNVNEVIINDFKLGYVPWKNNFHKKLLETYSEEDINLSGLYFKNEKTGKYIDRFNSRIIFPINNVYGETIAFGGRIIREGKLAKYINSPETEFYKKGNIIFNLDKAKDTRAKTKEVIIVEGYMDVVSLFSNGIKNVIANSGTALTERQINLIWRYFENPIICLDGDESGQKAAFRISEKLIPFINEKNKIFFTIMPEGQDPDDYVKKNGKDNFNKLLKDKQIIQSFIYNYSLRKINLNNPFEISNFEKEVKKLIYSIHDETLKKYVLEDFLEKLKNLTPLQTANQKFRYSQFPKKQDYKILKETKILHLKKKDLSKDQIIEFSILFIILNFFNIALTKFDKLVDLEFTSEKNENLKNTIISLYKRGISESELQSNIGEKFKELIEDIKRNSNIQLIIDKKSDTEIEELLEDLLIDFKEQNNLRKIESLEKKLINNLDENSYSELIKLKSQLNRE
tara:strand:+ start:515 stop:2302 length:1788 start_codon:yes stop_codon:yes gene_type:complete